MPAIPNYGGPTMKTSDEKVNQMILTGKAMDAFEELYADNVEMCENFDAPCVGKEANRKRELEFFGKVGEFHGAELLSQAYDDKNHVGHSEWVWDLTFKGGPRVQMKQVAVRRWKNGKVVHERFYYKPQM
jgi:hypothetical protein